MKSRIRLQVLLASLFVAASILASWAAADTAVMTPTKDNTLIETPVDNSNGIGDGFFAGRVGLNGGGTRRRGLLAFDVSSIPAGSTIDAVTLALEMAQSINATVQTVTLHRVSADWGESGSAGAGSGSLAQGGDATWLYRFFDTDAWTTSGGDFDAAASASASVGGIGPYSWAGAGLVADVQSWVDNPASNFGWLVRGNEDSLQAVKKFYSREGFIPPKLTVDYTRSTIGVQEPDAPAVSFAAPWPAPASGRVNLSYTLPRASRVSLAIHDATGRVVRHLVAGAVEQAGRQATVWDLRTDSGKHAASGVYLARLVVDGAAYQRRIPVVR